MPRNTYKAHLDLQCFPCCVFTNHLSTSHRIREDLWAWFFPTVWITTGFVVVFFFLSPGTGRFGAPLANAHVVSICADKEQRKPQWFLCSSRCVSSRQASPIPKNRQQQQSGCQTRNFLVVFKWFYSIILPTGGAAVDVWAVCLTVLGNKWFHIGKNNERGRALNKKWLSMWLDSRLQWLVGVQQHDRCKDR